MSFSAAVKKLSSHFYVLRNGDLRKHERKNYVLVEIDSINLLLAGMEIIQSTFC